MSDEDAVSDSFFDVSALSGEATDEDDALVGTVLDGRYRLDRLIGEGGMGRVYAGTQLSVKREVAIKLLRGEALAQREVKERFLREAQVISGFSHPNIVRLIDYGEDTERGFPYLVMELVRGVSLGELTRRGRLDLPLALEIAYQVCGALVQAHSADIIHRDLKPDNLQLMPVVGDSFQAKVLDFGIAFPREATSRITSTGMICGTAYYIAPEQARAMELDGRADLYALGIILYQMLSGHLPFRGDSDFQILLMQVQEPPPKLSDYLPPDEVPPEVIKLVHDLLAKDPDARPPSARAVRERIEVIRTRCAIAPLRLDLENASADAFERWILAPAESAPIFEASTALDGSTPPEVRDKLAARRQTMVEEDAGPQNMGPEDAGPEDIDNEDVGQEDVDQEDVDQETPAPDDAARSRQSSPQAPSKLPSRLVAVVAVALLVAGGVGIAAWQILGGAGGAETGAIASGDGDGDGEGLETDEHAATTPNASLSAFEGRCMVIGESDAWFHTVFLYPEVGELLLYGDDRLLWSPLEVTRRAGQSLEVSYKQPGGPRDGTQEDDTQKDNEQRDEPDAAQTRSMTVRSSADKLIFRVEGDSASAKKSKFVCRKHDVQKYYDTLGVSGTFGHLDDVDRAAEVPSSGQRITLDDEEYVYRILGGATLAEGHELALRQAEDTEAVWKSARVTFEQGSGVLTVVIDGNKEQYRSKKAARDAAEAAAERAARQAAEREEAARRKKAARAKAQSKARSKTAKQGASKQSKTRPTKAEPAPTAESDEIDWDDPANLPPHLRPAPERVYQKYAKKVRASVDRYCDVMEERSDQVAHHQKLVDEKRYDEAKTYRDEVLNDTTGYSQKIQAASYGYSNAVQRAAQAGLSSVQVQKLTKMWQDGCE